MRVLMYETYCGPGVVAMPGEEVALDESEARALVRAGRAKALDFEEPDPEPWDEPVPLRRPVMPLLSRTRKRNRRW